jgi:hypothetical protein
MADTEEHPMMGMLNAHQMGGLGQEWGSAFGTAHGTDPTHPAYEVDQALGRFRRTNNYKSSAQPAQQSSLEHASEVINAGANAPTMGKDGI